MNLSRDTVLGVVTVAVAGIYWQQATTIPQSLLSDAVGADGVPRMIALGMGLSGLLLAGRSVFRPAAAHDDDLPKSAHIRAAGLMGILVAYLLAVPALGYVLSVAGLIAAVAVYAGGRFGPVLAATAAIGAVAFWLMFKLLLGVPMPTGFLTWI